jgi:hypothetical protein
VTRREFLMVMFAFVIALLFGKRLKLFIRQEISKFEMPFEFPFTL